MLSPFERLLAFRYLRSRKAEGFVSVIAAFSFLGIMLGVATLIIVMAVMNGFRAELTGRMMGLNGNVSVYTPGAFMNNAPVLTREITGTENVTAILPFIETQALLSHKGSASGVVVRGYDPADFAWKPVINGAFIAGKSADFGGQNIAIGAKMAERLGLVPGDRLTLIAPQGRATPFGTIPRSQTFAVGVIFDVGMFEYNNSYVFMPIDAARVFANMPEGNVTGLEVHVSGMERVDRAKQAIAGKLGDKVAVYDWRESNQTFFNALQVERNVMFLILTLIILVAAFNIISSMIMLVKDKTRDIAILRTMGASRGSMLKIFMTTGASIGFAGTVAGAVLGISFALNIDAIKQALESLSGAELFAAEIYFLTHLPARIDWSEVVTVVGMACVLSVLSTLYPAFRAARLDPVEALRYE